MRNFNVAITETLKMNVTVEAETEEDAIQMVNDEWYKGTYILDADNFVGVNFEADEPFIELSYSQLSEVFQNVNRNGKNETCGYIVFTADSFDKPYSEQSRTYRVSSDNKAYQSGIGYSIYASCIDGTDINIRLDEYLHGEKRWKIERCYMHQEDYEYAISQPSKDEKELEER